ncbi:lipoprotein [Pikeienuella sp. HZG-20]
MSKRTRALIIIGLFVLVCASLVGCGRKGDPATPPPPSPSQGETAAQEG